MSSEIEITNPLARAHVELAIRRSQDLQARAELLRAEASSLDTEGTYEIGTACVRAVKAQGRAIEGERVLTQPVHRDGRLFVRLEEPPSEPTS